MRAAAADPTAPDPRPPACPQGCDLTDEVYAERDLQRVAEAMKRMG